MNPYCYLREVPGALVCFDFVGFILGVLGGRFQILAAQWATFICFLAEPLDGILRSCGQACVLSHQSLPQPFRRTCFKVASLSFCPV